MDQFLALLRKHRPTLVRVELADGSTREIRPPQDTRKRWEPVLELVGQLDVANVELLGAAGDLLAVWPAAAPAPDPAPGNEGLAAPDLDAAADRYLQRLVAAQREALSWQDRSVRTALDAVVAVMAQLGNAIASISRAHELERDQLRAALAESPAAPADEPQRDAILAQLAPIIAHKLLAPTPAPPQPQPTPKAKPAGS